MIIYTAFIRYNSEADQGVINLATNNQNPTPVEALLRPTQSLYNAYRYFSLQQELQKKSLSERQWNDIHETIGRPPKKTQPMSLYDFTSAYIALIRKRVSDDLPLFNSIFKADKIVLACSCKPGIHHFCHKYVVQEILDTSARRMGLSVRYGGELDELGRQYVPDRDVLSSQRRHYVSGEDLYYDPEYFAIDQNHERVAELVDG